MRILLPGLVAAITLALGSQARHAAADVADLGRDDVESFARLDVNNDGRIERTQAALFEPTLEAAFGYADRNGDGALNRPEFDEAMALDAPLFGAGERSQRKRSIFRSLDLDGDNAISATEARMRPAIAGAIRDYDANGDGRLDLNEFGDLSLAGLARR